MSGEGGEGGITATALPVVKSKKKLSSAELQVTFQGKKVINVTKKYVGIVESPALSNTGSQIEEWFKPWGLDGQGGHPWCACFIAGTYKEAGVSTSGIADPSVLTMWRNAKARGLLTLTPTPGCMILYGEFATYKDPTSTMLVGDHVEMFLGWHNPGARRALVIGGNTAIDGNPVTNSPPPTNHGVVVQLRNLLNPRGTASPQVAVFAVPTAIKGAHVKDNVTSPKIVTIR